MKVQDSVQPSTPLPPSGCGPRDASVHGQPPSIHDYELITCIGTGAYGDVWLARGTLGTFRAIKIVSRRSFEHDQPFEREFKGIQRFEPISLTHESQVKILHVGRNEAAGYFYYVMELADGAASKRIDGVMDSWIDGRTPAVHQSTNPPIQHPASYVPRTLKHEVQSRGRLPMDECVQIGLALTTALAHLHEHGLIHRDVKPSNIIFVNGVAKLADIGLVTDIEATRSFVGTEGFIPPEGPGTVGADIYSLGKVLYEISMGRSRLDFPALPANWDEIREADQARLLEFNEVLVKACESDASRRYATARQMHDELLLLQRGKSVKHKRAAEQRWATAKKLAVAGAVLALLITALPFLKGSKYGHTPAPETLREYKLGRVKLVVYPDDTQPTPEALRDYKLGQHYYKQLTTESHKTAIEFLNQALEADPQFVKPFRELTAIYVWNEGLFASKEENARKIREIADKIPKLAEGHAALSWWHFLQQDWRGAEHEIKCAIELDPDYPHARDIYSFYLSMLGRTDEAERQSRRSQELDPDARTTALVAAWPFITARQFDKAIEQLQRAVKLDEYFPEAHAFLGRCYEAQSSYVAAIEEFKKFDSLVKANPARVTATYDALRKAYDTMGEHGYFQKKIELICENESLPEAEQLFGIDNLVGCYAKLGDKVKALEELETHFNVIRRHELKFDPLYDPLHDEPRFKALLKKAGLEK